MRSLSSHPHSIAVLGCPPKSCFKNAPIWRINLRRSASHVSLRVLACAASESAEIDGDFFRARPITLLLKVLRESGPDNAFNAALVRPFGEAGDRGWRRTASNPSTNVLFGV